ncbi:MAG: hypothetical protein KF789_11665 [Bdellovibrionaceae bacterium]|nr:hypothetical protein [Pseudobdellovibrionaceae bacterium]
MFKALSLSLLILLSGALSWGQAVFSAEKAAVLETNGYFPWVWKTSDCVDCPIYFLSGNKQLESRDVQAFMRTLEARKSEIVRLYQIDGQEYNLLAHMAVGILGRESQFFKSRRYRLKETFPGLVRVAKAFKAYMDGSEKGPSQSSRGPTQIKIVPEKIASFYDITPESLHEPENAAVATVGFLIEILEELKRRVVLNDLEFVNDSNYVDYLPYLYFGSRRMLIQGNATPEKNIYVQDMKKYMGWVLLYEGQPSSTETINP